MYLRFLLLTMFKIVIPIGMMVMDMRVNFQLMVVPITRIANKINPTLKMIPSNKEVAACVMASKSLVTLEIKSPFSNIS